MYVCVCVCAYACMEVARSDVKLCALGRRELNQILKASSVGMVVGA